MYYTSSTLKVVAEGINKYSLYIIIIIIIIIFCNTRISIARANTKRLIHKIKDISNFDFKNSDKVNMDIRHMI